MGSLLVWVGVWYTTMKHTNPDHVTNNASTSIYNVLCYTGYRDGNSEQ